MPAVCWNTPCTPQKQPPATTTVWMPSAALASMAGAGITTASSAASDGAIATADMASAPRAAAQSARRLNWLRDIGFPLGGWMGSLGRWPLFAIGAGLPDVPKYAAGRHLLPPDGHEFVNKSRRFRASARRAARARLSGARATKLWIASRAPESISNRTTAIPFSNESSA